MVENTWAWKCAINFWWRFGKQNRIKMKMLKKICSWKEIVSQSMVVSSPIHYHFDQKYSMDHQWRSHVIVSTRIKYWRKQKPIDKLKFKTDDLSSYVKWNVCLCLWLSTEFVMKFSFLSPPHEEWEWILLWECEWVSVCVWVRGKQKYQAV